MTIGERIREARRARGMSLAAVSAEAEISAATLSRIETNKQSVDLPLFLVLARILRVAARDLLHPSNGEGNGDAISRPLAERIRALGVPQRLRLWKSLAAATRAAANNGGSTIAELEREIDELVAHVDFLRGELEGLLSRLRAQSQV